MRARASIILVIIISRGKVDYDWLINSGSLVTLAAWKLCCACERQSIAVVKNACYSEAHRTRHMSLQREQ